MNSHSLLRLAMTLKASGYSFTTVTPATHARVNSRLQGGWARNVTDIFGWNRPFKQDVIIPQLFTAMYDADVLASHGEGWISRVRASTLGDQLFLHSSYPTTCSDAIFFGPDTYRFANAITRYLANNVQVRRAVDIGCGAGPGAVMIALKRQLAEVFAVDINDTALRYTEINAQLAGAKRVMTRQSDLLDGVDGDFDLIVANPPYLMDTQQRLYRHGGGCFGEALSLRIAGLARTRLAPGGTILLYTATAIINGADPFLALVTPILNDTSLEWHYQELDPDVFGEELDEPAYAEADRIAAVLLTVRRLQ